MPSQLDTWRMLSDVPLEDFECTPQSVALRDGFVFGDYCGAMAVFDPMAGRWRDVTRPNERGWGFQLVAADTVALLLGQNVATRERFMAVYRS